MLCGRIKRSIDMYRSISYLPIFWERRSQTQRRSETFFVSSLVVVRRVFTFDANCVILRSGEERDIFFKVVFYLNQKESNFCFVCVFFTNWDSRFRSSQSSHTQWAVETFYDEVWKPPPLSRSRCRLWKSDRRRQQRRNRPFSPKSSVDRRALAQKKKKTK